MDIPPMEPCPYSKKGRHNLLVTMALDETGHPIGGESAWCVRCGARRHVEDVGSLDDMTAESILARIEGRA